MLRSICAMQGEEDKMKDKELLKKILQAVEDCHDCLNCGSMDEDLVNEAYKRAGLKRK